MKTVRHQLSRSLTALIGAACLAFAQAPVGPADRPANRSPEDTQKSIETEQALRAHALTALAPVTSQCFTSGSPAGSENDPLGRTFLKVCITNHGNISYLESPAGKVQINTREGYVVCSGDFSGSFVHGFDAGVAEDGWFEPTVSQPNGPGTLPLKVTRITLDGRIELNQTFTTVKDDREVQVQMDVKNRMPATSLQFVRVDRYFDGDIDGSATNDQWDQTAESIWASEPTNDFGAPVNNGLMLTHLSSTAKALPGLGSRTSVPSSQLFNDWNPNAGGRQLARTCTGPSTVSLFGFDGVGRVSTLLGDLAPGQTRTVTYRYRRF